MKVKGRRRKLWEINPNMFCSVIGTCLTLNDLHKITKKLKLTFPENIRDYEVHGYYVREAGKSGSPSRMMQKCLEKRHELAIKRFSRISSVEGLETEWAYCRDKGDIPGPYWAIMTSAAAPDDFVARVFGEIHMLSHLVGASFRNELGEKDDLQRQNTALAGELNKARVKFNRSEKALQELHQARAVERVEHDELKLAANRNEAELQAVRKEIAKFKNQDTHKELTRELQTRCQAVISLEKRTEKAESIVASQSCELNDLKIAKQSLEEANRSLFLKCRELEAAIKGNGDAEQVSDINLSGRRIVYVGGRSGAMGHFKSVVEQANGIFIHHDGGLEDKIARLPETIDQGDMVVCPVDCVSHSACQLAKKHCKRNDCPFVLLRSSGLSTFVNALNDIAVDSVHSSQ